MATSTMQATNRGSISWNPLTRPPLDSVGCGPAAAEGAGQLRDPEVHEIEIGIYPRGAVRVGRYDHRFRPRLLRHLEHLIPVVVVRRKQYLDVLIPHLVDHFEDVPRRGRDPRLGLDVVNAGDSVLSREVVPFLVITGDRFAAKRHRFLEPPAQPVDQRRPLVLLGLEEVEQLPLPVQVGEGSGTEQFHQLVPEERAVDPLLEVLLAPGEIVSVLRGHPLRPVRMLRAIWTAFIGSVQMWGLPNTWMSPCAREKLVGTSRRSIPA